MPAIVTLRTAQKNLVLPGGSIPPIVTTGLLAHYDATNSSSYPGSGTTWFDLSGNSLDLTLNNSPSYSTDFGGLINFNGTNQVAIRSGVTTLNSRTVWSFQGWFKVSDDTANYNIFFAIGRDSGGGTCPLIYVNYDVNSNKPVFEGSSGAYPINSATTGFNVWQNYAFTSDGTTVTAYQNGVSVGTNTLTGAIASSNSGIAIGALVSGDGSPFYFAGGDCGVFMVYTTGLSSAEVLQNYNNKKANYGY